MSHPYLFAAAFICVFVVLPVVLCAIGAERDERKAAKAAEHAVEAYTKANLVDARRNLLLDAERIAWAAYGTVPATKPQRTTDLWQCARCETFTSGLVRDHICRTF